MSVISLVIAPALKTWQVSSSGILTGGSPDLLDSVPDFILLMAAIVIIQKKIDAGYDVKRKLVKEAMEQEKAKAKAEAAPRPKLKLLIQRVPYGLRFVSHCRTGRRQRSCCQGSTVTRRVT